MNLENRAVEEFRQLYKQEYGICLDNQQVTEYTQRLIKFVKAVYDDNPPKNENKLLTTNNQKLNN